MTGLDEDQELLLKIKAHAISQILQKLNGMSEAELWRVLARLEMSGY